MLRNNYVLVLKGFLNSDLDFIEKSTSVGYTASFSRVMGCLAQREERSVGGRRDQNGTLGQWGPNFGPDPVSSQVGPCRPLPLVIITTRFILWRGKCICKLSSIFFCTNNIFYR